MKFANQDQASKERRKPYIIFRHDNSPETKIFSSSKLISWIKRSDPRSYSFSRSKKILFLRLSPPDVYSKLPPKETVIRTASDVTCAKILSCSPKDVSYFPKSSSSVRELKLQSQTKIFPSKKFDFFAKIDGAKAALPPLLEGVDKLFENKKLLYPSVFANSYDLANIASKVPKVNGLAFISASMKYEDQWKNPITLPPKCLSLALLSVPIPLTQHTNFDNLIELNINECGIDRFVFKASWTRLRNINLSKNALKSIAFPIASFPSVRSIDLSWNLLENVDDVIHACPNLREMNLARNKIKSVSNALNLAHLEDLDISCNDLSSIHFVQSAPRLKNFIFFGNPITFSTIFQLVYLQKVHCDLDPSETVKIFPWSIALKENNRRIILAPEVAEEIRRDSLAERLRVGYESRIGGFKWFPRSEYSSLISASDLSSRTDLISKLLFETKCVKRLMIFKRLLRKAIDAKKLFKFSKKVEKSFLKLSLLEIKRHSRFKEMLANAVMLYRKSKSSKLDQEKLMNAFSFNPSIEDFGAFNFDGLKARIKKRGVRKVEEGKEGSERHQKRRILPPIEYPEPKKSEKISPASSKVNRHQTHREGSHNVLGAKQVELTPTLSHSKYFLHHTNSEIGRSESQQMEVSPLVVQKLDLEPLSHIKSSVVSHKSEAENRCSNRSFVIRTVQKSHAKEVIRLAEEWGIKKEETLLAFERKLLQDKKRKQRKVKQHPWKNPLNG